MQERIPLSILTPFEHALLLAMRGELAPSLGDTRSAVRAICEAAAEDCLYPVAGQGGVWGAESVAAYPIGYAARLTLVLCKAALQAHEARQAGLAARQHEQDCRDAWRVQGGMGAPGVGSVATAGAGARLRIGFSYAEDKSQPLDMVGGLCSAIPSPDSRLHQRGITGGATRALGCSAAPSAPTARQAKRQARGHSGSRRA